MGCTADSSACIETMRVIEHIEDFAPYPHPIVTVGTFDGLHIGHHAIIDTVTKRATSFNGTSVLITFEPHPQTVVAPESAPFLLTTREEKVKLLEQTHIDVMLILNFTRPFSMMSAIDFIRTILVEKIGLKEIIVGCNHAFGKDRSGSISELEALGRTFNFSVQSVSPVNVDGRRVSSSWIREAVLKGNVKQASKLLGRPYSFSGTVIHGTARGRTLNYPTANIQKSTSRKLYPEDGVYAVRAHQGHRSFRGLLNIGHRPTFQNSDRMIEVHLFDFHENIYGREIEVEIIQRIRDERCFEGEEDLVTQIDHDKLKALHIFSDTSVFTEVS